MVKMKGAIMMYIYGDKNNRRKFSRENMLPYFDCEESNDDVQCFYDVMGDDNGCMYVNADVVEDGSSIESPFTVQAFDDELGIIGEWDFRNYAEALSCYEGVLGRGTIQRGREFAGDVFRYEVDGVSRWMVRLYPCVKVSGAGEWQSFKDYRVLCNYLDWALGERWLLVQ